MKKSIAELIDELSITNCKIFMFNVAVENGTNTVEGDQQMHKLNKYRSQLKNAINEELGDMKVETKTYK